MLISFFLTSKNYNKEGKIFYRLIRIIYPFEAWALLYYFLYKVLDFILGFKNNITLIDLLYQMSLGHSRYLNPPFWFIFDLLIITSIFFVIGKFFEKYMTKIFLLFLIFSLIVQYNNLNFTLFSIQDFLY
jgi:hypothetical protein